MKPRALIIEDDPEIVAALVDRLDSLGHDHDCIVAQTETRERLNRCTYDYIILDLELPVRFGRPASISTGKNILVEIRAHPKHTRVPVLVVTAYGHDGPDLAVDVMKLGATDFIKKPFANLEAAIDGALGKKQSIINEDPAAASKPKFAGGALVFHRDTIELDGTPVATPDNGTIFRILFILRERRNDGRPRAFPAKAIAETLGLSRGQNAVSEAVSAFRRKLRQILEEKGFWVDDDSIVVRGVAGYELAAHLTVDDKSGQPSKSGPESSVADAAARRAWILEQLKKKQKLRRADIEKKFRISPATAKRDLKELDNQIEFSGNGEAGFYRLVS
jgi:DNA-binding response OmpR family regulator